MNKDNILALKKNRLQILKSNGKNVDSQGVIKKLIRQICNMEQQKWKVPLSQTYFDFKQVGDWYRN